MATPVTKDAAGSSPDRKLYKSQLGEDARLEELFAPWLHTLNGRGTFVELGAMDGVRYSNTYMFAKKYGWKGWLFEPVPEMYASLKKNRPESECFNCCLGSSEGSIDLIGTNEVAGINSLISEGFREKWHQNSPVRTVPMRRMDSIIKSSAIQGIDLLSLDVEGAELEVLQGMDPGVKFHFIIIEAVERWNKGANELCRALLRERGYTFIERYKINEIWRLDCFSEVFLK
jgi:FkbM family methyltransferase